jgi:hypothetical protein
MAPVRSRPVDRSVGARAWFGATAAAVVVQLFVTAGLKGTPFPDLRGRLLNVFCYFTVQSNLLVALTCLLLAVRLDRRSTAFWVLRLTPLVAIAVTGIVFHIALKGLQDLQGAAAVADFLLHTLSPLMCVLGFLVFGPRARITRPIAVMACIFPLCWAVFAMVRGAFIHFYPYPFIDVDTHGYAPVLLNSLLVAVVFAGLSFGALALDRVLPRTRLAV